MNLNDLAIGGIKPIDDNPSRRNNRRKQGQGKKFSLNPDGEEDSLSHQETSERPVKKRKEPTPAPKKQEGGIDIII